MRLALAISLLVCAAAPALADDPPWAVGVTTEQKAAAQTLLDEGNSKFVEHDYVAALAKYRAAIATWDHPAIRFNMVRCLIQLDRPLEADDELGRALAYGAAPLEDSVYSEALAYGKLLAQQIGHVAVRCAQPGVEVTLDGKALAACPGASDQRVAPGAHTVIGTRTGFAPHTETLVVIGGQHAEVAVTLVPIAQAGVVVRRWATWTPWAVLGAGAGVAGLGALVELLASHDMTSYDAALATQCGGAGCSAARPVPAATAAQKTRAQRENTAAIGLVGLGIGAAVTSGVLLYLNRARTVYPAEHLELVPQAGGATLAWSGSF